MKANILSELEPLGHSIPDLEILTDQSSAKFRTFAERWSDIDRKTPAAILLPTTEEQIQKVVQWASETTVPFVAKSGGHSTWSTIDETGVIVDLSNYSGIEVDVEAHTATLKGSIVAKQVAVALAEHGLFTALGNGNPVGAIPYFLGGGASVVTSITGYGSDQILSARMIDANGTLVEVTETKEPDLLYALRGAGQFFGVETELTVKTYPFAKLGNEEGLIWTGIFMFPVHRADEVCSSMQVLMDDSSQATAGLLMLMAPPPARNPMIAVAARYTGNPDDAQNAYKALYDLKPVFAKGAAIPLHCVADGRDAFNAHGGFKDFGVVGLPRFDKAAFLEVVEVWKDLITNCPDAIDTSFNFQWDSRLAKAPGFESANSLHDIRFWLNNFIWYRDPTSRERVDAANKKSIEIMRGPDETEYVDFVNGTRSGPIELRFRNEHRLAKLRALKKKWDPRGVFTRELID
ncbi:FAD-binding domain-containing protein [Lophiostoma macrostomum CBS 122681]|uniref:FAD-binding domain-containing protein n=1 Tax=Lophiostoma macrostomum CBS 122681 TaxID=1314788 RepID=A0A6A6TAJ4_9PLEO|nr:FAD-binding domain-containing protein [Lophiostoma macrostomum CBS 122681]